MSDDPGRVAVEKIPVVRISFRTVACVTGSSMPPPEPLSVTLTTSTAWDSVLPAFAAEDSVLAFTGCLRITLRDLASLFTAQPKAPADSLVAGRASAFGWAVNDALI